MEGMARDILFMMIGMGAGMVTGPFMMKKVMRWRTGRKVDRMLREMARSNKEEEDTRVSS